MRIRPPLSNEKLPVTHAELSSGCVHATVEHEKVFATKRDLLSSPLLTILEKDPVCLLSSLLMGLLLSFLLSSHSH